MTEETNTTTHTQSRPEKSIEVDQLLKSWQELEPRLHGYIANEIQELTYITATFNQITELFIQMTELIKEIAQLTQKNTVRTVETTAHLQRGLSQKERSKLLSSYSFTLMQSASTFDSKVDALKVKFGALKSQINVVKEWTLARPGLYTEPLQRFFAALQGLALSTNGGIVSLVQYKNALDEGYPISQEAKEGIARTINVIQKSIELHQEMRDYYEGAISTPPIRITLINSPDFEQINTTITLNFIAEYLLPLLDAQNSVSQILTSLVGRTSSALEIKHIQSFSPVTVDGTGISDLINTFAEILLPQRRAHAQRIRELDIKKKEAEIKSIEIILANDRKEARVKDKKIEQELELLKTATALKLAEVKKLEQEIRHAEIKMVLEVVEAVAPNHTQEQKLDAINRLLTPAHTLLISPLEASLAVISNEEASK